MREGSEGLTGRFFSKGAVLKCSSMSWAPARNLSTMGNLVASRRGWARQSEVSRVRETRDGVCFRSLFCSAPVLERQGQDAHRAAHGVAAANLRRGQGSVSRCGNAAAPEERVRCQGSAETARKGTHPVPEGEGVFRVDAEVLHELEVRGHRHHVLRDGVLAERGRDPRAHGAGVEHRLCGGERLGDDNDEGRLLVEAVEGAGDVHLEGVCGEVSERR